MSGTARPRAALTCYGLISVTTSPIYIGSIIFVSFVFVEINRLKLVGETISYRVCNWFA